MNLRTRIAMRYPIARADESLHPRYWRKLYIEGLWLSTIVTLNK